MKRKITDFQPDPQNANKGTERGVFMVEESLHRYGAGRSIVVDKNGIILAGNKTQQAAIDIGLEDAEVIETDGTKLVVVRRTDLDLLNDPKRAREYSISDNRSSQVGLEWDAEVLAALQMDEDIDLSQFFFDWELDAATGANTVDQSLDYEREWQGMPEFEQEANPVFHSIRVSFENQEDMECFSKLIEQTITDKTTHIYYPYKPRKNTKIYENES